MTAVVVFQDAKGSGEAVAARFLVDTGADRSLIVPGDYESHRYVFDDFRSAQDVDLRGFGGSLHAKLVLAKLILVDESGKHTQLGLEIEVAGPAPEIRGLPSVMGRDVIDNFRLIIDRSVSLVALDERAGGR